MAYIYNASKSDLGGNGKDISCDVAANQGDRKEVFSPGEDKFERDFALDEEDDYSAESEMDPRRQKWSESLKARLFCSADKDGNFFSYMFLDKIFGEARPCAHCGARGSAKLSNRDNSLQVFVIEEGIIGTQTIMCEKCEGIETVISGEDPSLLPQDIRLSIKGMEIRDFCRKITHYEVLHDVMEMLHIAAIEDETSRQEKHSDLATFMLHNARKICEEWCRAEHAELRLKKYLRLREETLLTKYKPTFTPDCTEEYRDMYEMMTQSFRQNRSKILILLQLLKESLIDNPSRSTFMMWLSIAMMHSESYPKFKKMYDPRSFMRIESSEYEALQEHYLSLDVPLAIKKIPVIFVLFEIPRFYHYVDFLNERIGRRKSRSILTDEEREELKFIEEETAKLGLGRSVQRRGRKTKTMVSPEAHLDFLTRQEEIEREKVYQSYREKAARTKESIKLGRQCNKKVEPKSQLHSIEVTSHRETPKDTPLLTLATPPPQHKPGEDKIKETDSVEAMESQSSLSKAQIKRRRKKAIAASAASKPTENVNMENKNSTPSVVTNEPSSGTQEHASASEGKKVSKNSKSGSNKVHSMTNISATSSPSNRTLESLDEMIRKIELPNSGTRLSDKLDRGDPRPKLFQQVPPLPLAVPPNTSSDVTPQKHLEGKGRGANLLNGGTSPSASGVSKPASKSAATKEKPTPPSAKPVTNSSSESTSLPWALTPAGLSEKEKTQRILTEAALNAPLPEGMSVEEVKYLVKDLTSLSYPVIISLMDSVNVLPTRQPVQDLGKAKMVSVMPDPFFINTGGPDPRSGAIVFLKTKNGTKPLSQGAESDDEDTSGPSSVLSALRLATTGQNPSNNIKLNHKGSDERSFEDDKPRTMANMLAKILEEEPKLGSDEEVVDYSFKSIKSTYLPKQLRELVESEERGEELETTYISGEDFKLLLKNLREHGVVHQKNMKNCLDTETILCLPSALNFDPSILKEKVHEVPDPIQKSTESVKVPKEKKKKKAASSDSPKVAKPPPPPAPSSFNGSASSTSFRTPLSFDMNDDTKYDRNSSRRARREAIKNAKKTLKKPGDHQAVMVTQVDTEILKRQGFKVDPNATKATVIANKDGAIIHVLEGEPTPQQVRDHLSKRYSIISQQMGPGYITMPTKDHPGGLLVDPKMAANEDIPKDKFVGNRKKLKSKKKAIQDKQYSSLSRWPVPRPKNPYSEPLGLWATQGAPWPEGLDYGTEYHSDREVMCGSDDEELVKAVDRDAFGNHSMLMRLEVNTADVPNEEAAETVMNRYMEPADLGPGIDPKVPRYIIPSSGATPGASKKLPPGTRREDVPVLMRFAAPHKQMRALDALRIPYKYELTQVLTPDLTEDGEVNHEAPKRIAILSKITLLPKSRYRSLAPPTEEVKEEESKPSKEEPEEVKKEEVVPKISKSQRKKMKMRQKQKEIENATANITDSSDGEEPVDEVVHSKMDHTQMDHTQMEMMEGEFYSVDDSRSRTTARDKFKFCENCGQEIVHRILVCAGCKRVAYCNFRCQKASWKVHKKTCSYALRKGGKESTG